VVGFFKSKKLGLGFGWCEMEESGEGLRDSDETKREKILKE